MISSSTLPICGLLSKRRLSETQFIFKNQSNLFSRIAFVTSSCFSIRYSLFPNIKRKFSTKTPFYLSNGLAFESDDPLSLESVGNSLRHMMRDEDGMNDGVRDFYLMLNLCRRVQNHLRYDEELAKNLFKAGLISLQNKGFNLNAPLILHYSTPLREAAANGCSALCRALVELGVPIDGADDFPLLAAVANGYLETIRALVEMGANVNKRIDSSGISHPTAIFERILLPKIIQYLPEKDAYLYKKIEYPQHAKTALEKACLNGNVEVVSLLFELGAVASQQDQEETFRKICCRLVLMTSIDVWTHPHCLSQSILEMCNFFQILLLINQTEQKVEILSCLSILEKYSGKNLDDRQLKEVLSHLKQIQRFAIKNL